MQISTWIGIIFKMSCGIILQTPLGQPQQNSSSLVQIFCFVIFIFQRNSNFEKIKFARKIDNQKISGEKISVQTIVNEKEKK